MSLHSKLTGADLDLAVAMTGEWKTAHALYPTMTLDPTFSGARIITMSGAAVCMLTPSNPFRQDPQQYSPSMDWRIGGPLIERERIRLEFKDGPGVFEGVIVDGPRWLAAHPGNLWLCEIGPTPLVAAMRALVAAWGRGMAGSAA